MGPLPQAGDTYRARAGTRGLWDAGGRRPDLVLGTRLCPRPRLFRAARRPGMKLSPGAREKTGSTLPETRLPASCDVAPRAPLTGKCRA